MRHRRKTVKLGRTAAHRDSMLANMACSLIEHGRIRTTLAKAKALRPFVEKVVTIGKKGNEADEVVKKDGKTIHSKDHVHYRRRAYSYLRQKPAVSKLFEEVAVAAADRKGGYTRITKLGQRQSDAAPMAFIEWVDLSVAVDDEGEGED